MNQSTTNTTTTAVATSLATEARLNTLGHHPLRFYRHASAATRAAVDAVLDEEDADNAAAKLRVIEDAHIAQERLQLRPEEHRSLMRSLSHDAASVDEARGQLEEALKQQRQIFRFFSSIFFVNGI